MTAVKKYWVFSVLLVLALEAYPLYMGAKVWLDVLEDGIVLQAD